MRLCQEAANLSVLTIIPYHSRGHLPSLRSGGPAGTAGTVVASLAPTDETETRDTAMTAPQPLAPEPQPIVTPLRTAAIFLVLTIDPGGEDTVRDFLADATGLQRAVGFRLPEGELAAVIGIGADAWDRLFSGARPSRL